MPKMMIDDDDDFKPTIQDRAMPSNTKLFHLMNVRQQHF